jgi:flavin-dependent dehydrogenase
MMKLSPPPSVADSFASMVEDGNRDFNLQDGSRVAVVGGGPSGSFFSYFLLKMARAIDLDVEVDIYEPRSFSCCGPAGCNHCGGIVSESLVQILAAEGIVLPRSVVQRGVESYVVHMDVGDVTIESPVHEQRIAALYRGNGPREGNDV